MRGREYRSVSASKFKVYEGGGKRSAAAPKADTQKEPVSVETVQLNPFNGRVLRRTRPLERSEFNCANAR
ncbi:hypothetical protein NDU88_001604 [Pleurodeles waltl]|uniref:Uncharacterized protein n=1 Tax=Pleurodeles waltl TaxID=8319 RepID=A0AAV7UWH9_PLEWA|nr:hypothetical protein NDU88_001604 [Pleurodeles waltl]